MKNKFLYMNIYDAIKKKIENGELLPDEKLPTELEMESMFDVSRITVKKALTALKKDGFLYSIRGSGTYVSKIESPEPSKEQASNIDGSRLITMMLPFNMAESNFVDTINGASKYLSERGYYLTIRSNIDTIQEEKEILEASYRDVAGILLFPLSTDENFKTLNKLYLNQYPIVMIDRYNEFLPINYVVTDNFKGGYDATQHLIQQGHKKIAFVCDLSIEKFTTLRNRYLGYCKAMEEANLLDSKLIHIGFNKGYSHKHMPDTYEEIMKKLVARQVTGVFAANDLLATYVISAATEQGFDVPSDLSVIGFDNDPHLSRYFPKAITTMSQAFYEMGRIAAENLLHLIEGEHTEVKIKLPTTLVIKDTVSEPQQP